MKPLELFKRLGGAVVALFLVMAALNVTVDSLWASIVVGITYLAAGLAFIYVVGGREWFRNFPDPRDYL